MVDVTFQDTTRFPMAISSQAIKQEPLNQDAMKELVDLEDEVERLRKRLNDIKCLCEDMILAEADITECVLEIAHWTGVQRGIIEKIEKKMKE